jgi:hypothetical protein
MPGEMARSAAHPPFRAVHVAAAVRVTHLPCQNAGKAQKFALVRGSYGESQFLCLHANVSPKAPAEV